MRIKQAIVAMIVCLSAVVPVCAAADQPVELVGDVIEYASKSGVITATGNVRVTQDGAVVTGTAATYNTKQKTGEITGGVTADKGDMHMTAAVVKALSGTQLTALGDVVMTKADSAIYGDRVDYDSEREVAVLPVGGRVVHPDATITADYMESFIKENRTIGNGNVHIVSQTRNIDAVSDNCEYLSAKGEQNKVILTGNAVVVQDGNTLRGNKMTLLLDDAKNVQTQPAQ